MGVEQEDTTKSTLFFLDICQRRKERWRGKHTETQSLWMCFTKKRSLLVEKKQPRERKSLKKTQREDD